MDWKAVYQKGSEQKNGSMLDRSIERRAFWVGSGELKQTYGGGFNYLFMFT